MRIENEDFYLNPPELLPPPLVMGKVGGVEVTDSAMVLTFQPQDSGAVKLLKVPEVKSENYMFHRGGVLRFGKLTMHETDLMIVDAEPKTRSTSFWITTTPSWWRDTLETPRTTG